MEGLENERLSGERRRERGRDGKEEENRGESVALRGSCLREEGKNGELTCSAFVASAALSGVVHQCHRLFVLAPQYGRLPLCRSSRVPQLCELLSDRQHPLVASKRVDRLGLARLRSLLQLFPGSRERPVLLRKRLLELDVLRSGQVELEILLLKRPGERDRQLLLIAGGGVRVVEEGEREVEWSWSGRERRWSQKRGQRREQKIKNERRSASGEQEESKDRVRSCKLLSHSSFMIRSSSTSCAESLSSSS